MRNSSADHMFTVLVEFEFTNALELRVFRKDVSAAQARTSLREFEEDLRNKVFLLQPFTDQVFEEARQLSRKTTARLGARTADLLHVAAALELQADIIYTFDRQQRTLAQAVRVKTN
jgi:predicted nucleic acid-binding protein